jgi:hypothetical protein
MPIALNMTFMTFKFGQVIHEEGQVPECMYLIKSGQCKIAVRRVVTQKAKKIQKTKLTVDENNELFRRFDPETSLLNGTKNNQRMQ